MNISKSCELTFHNFEEAANVAELLTNNGYACMLTREEGLTVLNYVYAFNLDNLDRSYNSCVQEADRNQVVFMSLEDYYDQLEQENELEENKD